MSQKGCLKSNFVVGFLGLKVRLSSAILNIPSAYKHFARRCNFPMPNAEVHFSWPLVLDLLVGEPPGRGGGLLTLTKSQSCCDPAS